jgi:hypothetical protein
MRGSWELWSRVGPITVRLGDRIDEGHEWVEAHELAALLNEAASWPLIARIDAELTGGASQEQAAPSARSIVIARVRRAVFERRLVAQRARSSAPPPMPPEAEAVESGYSGEPTQKSWIEIELVDQDDKPVPRAPFTIELPDGTIRRGNLNHLGFARVDGIDPGSCKVRFPKLEGRLTKAA